MIDGPIDELKALAHPSRFAIAAALAEGDANVTEIERITGVGQPGLSQQLAILRDACLVRSRRSQKHVYYSLNDQGVDRLRSAFRLLFSGLDNPADHKCRYDASHGVAVFARMRTQV